MDFLGEVPKLYNVLLIAGGLILEAGAMTWVGTTTGCSAYYFITSWLLGLVNYIGKLNFYQFSFRNINKEKRKSRSKSYILNKNTRKI